MQKVYILHRTGKRKAKLYAVWKVWDAQKVEKKLHRIFSVCGVDVRKSSPPLFGKHIKIGISNNPESRVEDINESGLFSGKTEWFHLRMGSRFVLYMLLSYHQHLLLIRLVVVFCLVVLIAIILKTHI